MLQNILVEEAEKASRADSGSRGSPTGATSGRIASSRLLLTTTQHSAAGSPPLPTPSTPASSRPTDASAVSPAGHQTRIFLLVEGVGDGHVANSIHGASWRISEFIRLTIGGIFSDSSSSCSCPGPSDELKAKKHWCCDQQVWTNFRSIDGLERGPGRSRPAEDLPNII